MKGLRLGIVIVSWNVCELLDQCLESLSAACNESSTLKASGSVPTVAIVDNASSDRSVQMVQNKHPWVKLDACSENLGYVAANNKAIQAMCDEPSHRPDALWLLNPDTVVHRTTISDLLLFLSSHPKAGLIGPQLLNTDGTFQESAFRFPGLFQPMFDFGMLPQRLYFTTLNGRYAEKNYGSKEPFRIDHPLGAGMMARTTAIDEIGLLDEKFFMYCEEIDWAWRMKKSGWESWLVPNAKLTHYGGASTNQDKPATTAFLWESRARLYRKHRSRALVWLVSRVVRKYFSSQSVTSLEWGHTYTRILSAWEVNSMHLPKENYQ